MRIPKKRLKQIREAEEKFFRQIGVEWPYKPPKQNKHTIDPDRRLTLADPHAPYTSKAAMEASLTERSAAVVTVAGDIGDYASKSRFPKTEWQSWNDEVRGTFFFLEWLHINFPGKKKIMKGNHDDRSEKRIMQLLAGDTDLLVMTNRDLLGQMVSYFPDMEMVGTEVVIRGEGKEVLGHVFQLGDVVTLHAERSQKQESSLLEALWSQVLQWGPEFGLGPWRVLLDAHVHNDAHCWRGDKYLATLPCLMDFRTKGGKYALQAKMQYKPPKVGYTVFNQVNGKTDINSIRKVIL